MKRPCKSSTVNVLVNVTVAIKTRGSQGKVGESNIKIFGPSRCTRVLIAVQHSMTCAC